MGTLQKRIDDAAVVMRDPPSYLNRNITAVLKDNRVHFGKFVGTTSTGLVVRNMRGRRVELPASVIRELYVDSNY